MAVHAICTKAKKTNFINSLFLKSFIKNTMLAQSLH